MGYSPWGHKNVGHNLATKQQQLWYPVRSGGGLAGGGGAANIFPNEWRKKGIYVVMEKILETWVWILESECEQASFFIYKND